MEDLVRVRNELGERVGDNPSSLLIVQEMVDLMDEQGLGYQLLRNVSTKY